MASQAVLRTFVTNSSARMQKPIRDYFQVVNRFGADSLQARVAQSLTNAELGRVLRSIHTQAALLGSAGNLTTDAKGILQAIVEQDTYYLNRFMAELPKLSEGQALTRANLYVGTAKGTVSDIASLDLPTLGIYPKSSQLECGRFCKCSLDIRYLFGEQNWDIYWQLDQTGGVEHCNDCLRLAASWKPLRIRDNRIVGVKQITEHDFTILKAALLRVA